MEHVDYEAEYEKQIDKVMATMLPPESRNNKRALDSVRAMMPMPLQKQETIAEWKEEDKLWNS